MFRKFQAWRMKCLSRRVYRQQVKNVKGDDIQQYAAFGKQKKTDRIIRRLYKMACKRSAVYDSHPVTEYGLTRDEFHQLFICMLQYGAGRWERGFYPPVAGFCSETTLKFLCMNKHNILDDEHLRTISVQMLLTYFAGIYILPNVDMKEAQADPLSALENAVRELEQMV